MLKYLEDVPTKREVVMLNFTAELIAIIFSVSLLALIVALIFEPKFRDAVLGGPGEATIVGLITVKGVVIVLLSALLIGGIMYLLKISKVHLPPIEEDNKSIPVQLNVHFEPDEVNTQHSDFNVTAYIKTSKGPPKIIERVVKVQQGTLSVKFEVPDMQTPFFVVFDTVNGTWRTYDFSIHETMATARKDER